MSDVEIPVRLRRESGAHIVVHSLSEIFVDLLLNKILRNHFFSHVNLLITIIALVMKNILPYFPSIHKHKTEGLPGKGAGPPSPPLEVRIALSIDEGRALCRRQLRHRHKLIARLLELWYELQGRI